MGRKKGVIARTRCSPRTVGNSKTNQNGNINNGKIRMGLRPKVSEAIKEQIRKNPGYVVLKRLEDPVKPKLPSRSRNQIKKKVTWKLAGQRRSKRLGGGGSLGSPTKVEGSRTSDEPVEDENLSQEPKDTTKRIKQESNQQAETQEVKEIHLAMVIVNSGGNVGEDVEATGPRLDSVTSTPEQSESPVFLESKDEEPHQEENVKKDAEDLVEMECETVAVIAPLVEADAGGSNETELKEMDVEVKTKPDDSDADKNKTSAITSGSSDPTEAVKEDTSASRIDESAFWDQPVSIYTLQNAKHSPYYIKRIAYEKNEKEPKVRFLKKPQPSTSLGSKVIELSVAESEAETSKTVSTSTFQNKNVESSPSDRILLELRPKNRTTYFEVNSREVVPIEGFMKEMPGINGSNSVRDIKEILKDGVLDRNPTHGDVENLEYFMTQMCRFEYLCETYELVNFLNEEIKKMKRGRVRCLWIVLFQNLIQKTQNRLLEVTGGVFKLE